MSAGDAIALTHLAATLYLTGLIWTVQRVHYPAFDFVAPERFAEFESFHQRRITPVVAPAMIVELATAIALLFLRPAWLGGSETMAAALLLAVIWASTFAVQVPVHRRLSSAYAPASTRLLVASNWIRTAAWSARSALLVWSFASGHAATAP